MYKYVRVCVFCVKVNQRSAQKWKQLKCPSDAINTGYARNTKFLQYTR